jgi:hypothetical protein
MDPTPSAVDWGAGNGTRLDGSPVLQQERTQSAAVSRWNCRAADDGGDKCGKQLLLRGRQDEEFRMPLHPDQEVRSRPFDGLYDPRLVAGDDPQIARPSLSIDW